MSKNKIILITSIVAFCLTPHINAIPVEVTADVTEVKSQIDRLAQFLKTGIHYAKQISYMNVQLQRMGSSESWIKKIKSGENILGEMDDMMGTDHFAEILDLSKESRGLSEDMLRLDRIIEKSYNRSDGNPVDRAEDLYRVLKQADRMLGHTEKSLSIWDKLREKQHDRLKELQRQVSSGTSTEAERQKAIAEIASTQAQIELINAEEQQQMERAKLEYQRLMLEQNAKEIERKETLAIEEKLQDELNAQIRTAEETYRKEQVENQVETMSNKTVIESRVFKNPNQF